MDDFASATLKYSTDDLTDKIEKLRSQYEIFQFMKTLVKLYRARSFVVFNLPPNQSNELQSNIILTSWSPELIDAYAHEDSISQNPLLQRLRGSTLPFFCDANEARGADLENNNIAAILGLMRRFNMDRCAHFPVHDTFGARGCVSIAGDREKFTPLEITELSFIAIHVFERLSYIRDMDMQFNETLTDREVDCLKLTADGKTSTEIADIVRLSEHTVNQYVNRVIRKLNAVNRTQAVAKALRMGIIT